MLDMNLGAAEIRVLGSLIEKELATPQYYPLTLNSLVSACNQKSSRDPVVEYDEATVETALETLTQKGLASNVRRADSRTLKYAHEVYSRIDISRPEIAALCVMLLRGPQTVGEVKARTGRMCEFADLTAVQTAVDSLSEAGLAVKLPRQPGTKESRYAHCLGAEAPRELAAEPAQAGALPLAAPAAADIDRIAELEERVARLEEELTQLKRELGQ